MILFEIPKVFEAAGIIDWEGYIDCVPSASGICNYCGNQDFGMANTIGNCEPICGDSIISKPEECEIEFTPNCTA